MSHWIEVPAHRILEVPVNELDAEFIAVDTDGNECAGNQSAELIVRKKDGKIFKLAQFFSMSCLVRQLVYLREI